MSQSTTKPPKRMRPIAKWFLALSCMNLAALCVVSYLLHVVSETWWIGTVFTYAPRTPYLAPTLLLILISIIRYRESLGINLVSLAIIVVPIMELSLPIQFWCEPAHRQEGEFSLKVISCNVQRFRPDFDKILEEMIDIKPDVIALQEAHGGDPRLAKYFPDWNALRHEQYWIGSRYPLRFVSDIQVNQFHGRNTGLIVEVDTPAGPVILGNIHQMTARFGLMNLNHNTLINGDGTKQLEDFESERRLEIIEIRSAIDKTRGDRPLIVCGDFNTPTSSCLFRKTWSDLQSCFDVVGIGYGYTSPCKGNRFWPDNLPWARIDHILCSHEWAVRECQIGKSDGSDHRLIAATIQLKTDQKRQADRSKD